MVEILKRIIEELPKLVSDAVFEGANIVLYTKDKDFFLNNSGTITGRLFVDGNICGNNSFTLTGAVIATGTFEMNNNLTIITDPDMAVGGSPTSFSPGMVSFMEASW